jgi:DNA repair protein RadC
MTVQNQTVAARAAEPTPNDHAYIRDLKAAIDADARLATKAVRCAQQPQEWKLVPMRECPTPGDLLDCSNPSNAVAYWCAHVTTHPFYNPEVECAVVLLLNTRRRVKGHCLLAVGTLDAVLVHPREVFRAAVLASASSVIMMHNHPSGDPSPSTSDIANTHQVRSAGKALRIELLDHIIVGNPEFRSLRQLEWGAQSPSDFSGLPQRIVNRIYTKMEPQERARLRARLFVEYGPPHTWPPEFDQAKQDAIAA